MMKPEILEMMLEVQMVLKGNKSNTRYYSDIIMMMMIKNLMMK